MASITTSPRIASRPLLVSQITPLTWLPSTSVRENHECRRSSMPCFLTISIETRFQASGSNAAAKQIGCGFSLLWKSKVPQRAQRSTEAGALPHSSCFGNAARPSAAMRSIISMQVPRTEISCRWLSHMSSSTSTMPPEARPPRWL